MKGEQEQQGGEEEESEGQQWEDVDSGDEDTVRDRLFVFARVTALSVWVVLTPQYCCHAAVLLL